MQALEAAPCRLSHIAGPLASVRLGYDALSDDSFISEFKYATISPLVPAFIVS